MKYNPAHLDLLKLMFPLIQFAEESRKEIMPTRQELELAGISKRELKDLVKHDYVKTENMIIREDQKVCGRVVHYLTPKAIDLLLATGAIKENEPAPAIQHFDSAPVSPAEPLVIEPSEPAQS